MKVGEFMRRDPIQIRQRDTLAAAQAAMMRHGIRHLPVMDGSRLVGMLSERDVLAARAACHDEPTWWALPVQAAMQSPAQTANAADSLTEVAARMAAAKIGALPVVDRGQLIAIVTVPDVLEAEVRSAMAPAPRIAADAMTPLPVTVAPDAPLEEAIALLVDHNVHHLPVVDEASTIVGMISERDIRDAVGSPAGFLAHRTFPSWHRVSDVMAAPAVTVWFDEPLAELANRFADERLSAMPVLDKFGALIGIVSYIDILRALAA